MPTKSIRCSNVTEKEGKYGPSLSIGHKVGDEWVNYYVNKPELFTYFKKGQNVTVEYEVKNGYNVINGVAPAGGTAQTGGGSQESGGERSRSIELQVLCKVAGDVMCVSGGTMPTPVEFAEWVCNTHALIFDAPKPAAEGKLEAAVAEAQQALDATVEEEDDIPFG